MVRPLTEKTLELNVMAELAYLSRVAGYSPYFIGFSQLDEMRHGGDAYYSTGAMMGFFQFKRGYPRSSFFTFYVNNNAPHFNQHDTLKKTDAVCGACRYVFPLIGTNEDVYSFRGNLLSWTAFLPPWKLDPLLPSTTPHRIRIYFNGTWARYSDEKRGQWVNIYGVIPKETPTYELDNLPTEERSERAKEIFKRLELPKIENVLAQIDGLKNKDIKDIFEQRSSFCMVFNEE